MNLEQIESLLELLNSQNVSEFTYEDEEINLSVRLGAVIAAAPAVVHAPAPVAVAAPAPAAPAPAAADEVGVTTVNSPMPGTFYRASSPEAGPYVELGDRVRKGQVLCIIEAMKMMNELECEVDGVISAILVDNAQPVQFGQPIFKIKTT
jgi:acetyl-CoA carboxylase biotin carboxyl carrier protein